MSEQKMREALRAAYLAGSQYGHNATVEGFWADDPDIASDYVDEALAGHLAQPDGQCSYCRTYNGHQDGCIYAPPAPSEQPAQGEAAGWLTDQGTFHFDKTDAWNDSEGFIEPLYTAPPAPAVQKDKGPWRAERSDLDDNPLTGVWVESDDFDHDVRLYVNGDFAAQAQRFAYAEQIAEALNAPPAPAVPDGWGLAAFQHKWEACETQCQCKVCGTVFTAAPEVPRG